MARKTGHWLSRLAGSIKAQGISKHFGSFQALQNVSLSIQAGEFLTLLGPSGSGKTTFLMVLAGFEAATAGTITMDGQDMTTLGPGERRFGMVFQGYALFPHMSVADNIAFPLKVRRAPGTNISHRVNKMIEMVGLGEHTHKRPAALSGGQQQRVALARALACEPPVLLLDEPFSALDKNLRAQMQDEMRRIHSELGTTFVFVTHDQSEALALSSKVAIFSDGQLQQFGTPDEVYDRPGSRFVAEFLGDINILSADISPQGALVEGRQMLIRSPSTDHTACHLAVRPEHLVASVSAPCNGQNALQGQVVDAVYLGSALKLSLRTRGGNMLSVNVPAGSTADNYSLGKELWASWEPKHCFAI